MIATDAARRLPPIPSYAAHGNVIPFGWRLDYAQARFGRPHRVEMPAVWILDDALLQAGDSRPPSTAIAMSCSAACRNAVATSLSEPPVTAPLPDGPACRCGSDFASPLQLSGVQTRIDSLAQGRGRAVDLRPFLLGPTTRRRAGTIRRSAVSGAEARMMRDISAWPSKYGVVYKHPRLFPRMSVCRHASRWARTEPWCRISAWCLPTSGAGGTSSPERGARFGLSLDADALILRQVRSARRRCAAR